MKITNYHTRGEHANHYTINALLIRDRPLTCRGRGAMGLFFVQNIFLDHTRVRILIFLSGKARFFFPEFNIRLYDKNSESDYFFFLHQNQNIFSATLGIRIFFLEKKPTAPPWKLNGPSLSERRLYHKNTTI